MEKLQHVPKHCMPSLGTLAYKLLAILSDGSEHPTKELIELLGSDPRSPLQALKNDTYGFWLIHNIGDNSGCYVLDQRHLTGDKQADMEARKIAKITLRERSREIAEREACRLGLARQQETKAKTEKQVSMDFITGDTQPRGQS